MGTSDPRVDAYIEKAADFAKPILYYLREVVHDSCPDVEETMKWSFVHFTYRGNLCHMASFKEHCAFGFWKSALLVGEDSTRDAMGDFGRITSIDDLPPRETLDAYIKEAMHLNEAGIKVPTRKKPKPELDVPPDFEEALEKNAAARATFEGFPPGQRREYIEWITEAKRDETRRRRLETAIEWLAEGKIRNWKYT